MNSGQQLLTIFAVAILTVLILQVYNSQSSKDEMLFTNEAIISGTGIAQSLINEIQAKAFDEKTISQGVADTDSLTLPNSLGLDAGEVLYTQYDDIDDYNNFTRSDSLGRLGLFNTKVEVYYIVKMTPGVKSSIQTFTKEIEISLTNFSLPDTIKFYQVIAY